MSNQIVVETLVYRIGLIAFSLVNSLLVVLLFKRSSRRLASALRWLVVVSISVGIVCSGLVLIGCLSPFSKQVAHVFYSQAVFLMALNYVARPFYSLD